VGSDRWRPDGGNGAVIPPARRSPRSARGRAPPSASPGPKGRAPAPGSRLPHAHGSARPCFLGPKTTARAEPGSEIAPSAQRAPASVRKVGSPAHHSARTPRPRPRRTSVPSTISIDPPNGAARGRCFWRRRWCGPALRRIRAPLPPPFGSPRASPSLSGAAPDHRRSFKTSIGRSAARDRGLPRLRCARRAAWRMAVWLWPRAQRRLRAPAAFLRIHIRDPPPSVPAAECAPPVRRLRAKVLQFPLVSIGTQGSCAVLKVSALV
jgi:hypothetical protein